MKELITEAVRRHKVLFLIAGLACARGRCFGWDLVARIKGWQRGQFTAASVVVVAWECQLYHRRPGPGWRRLVSPW